MKFSAPNYAVQAPVAASISAKIAIFVGVGVIAVVSICAIAIGLGVGIGIGHKNKLSSLLSIVSCDANGSTCGCAETKPTFLSTKIINGYNATAHSWPWVVALFYAGSFTCGGFLAESYQFVITAAHCLKDRDPSLMQIYAGVESISSPGDAQFRDVSAWKIHPDYFTSSVDTYNDIGVIKLISSFDKNDNVGLCCLPSGSTQLPIVGETAVIVGWGDTKEGDDSSLSDILLQTVIEIQESGSDCDVSTTSKVQFCAGLGTSDTCQGDSGGPLMTTVNNSWTCTGIVSHGVGCGRISYYARVSAFISFIDNATSTL